MENYVSLCFVMADLFNDVTDWIITKEWLLKCKP